MESLTYMKQLRVSPKSLRFMVSEVKRYSPQQSLDVLFYSPKKEARVFYKVISSAINNAVQTLKVGADMLQFKLLTVEQGRPLKRYRPGARGGVRPIKKKYAHIKVILESKPVVIVQEKAIEKEIKAPKKIDNVKAKAKKVGQSVTKVNKSKKVNV